MFFAIVVVALVILSAFIVALSKTKKPSDDDAVISANIPHVQDSPPNNLTLSEAKRYDEVAEARIAEIRLSVIEEQLAAAKRVDRALLAEQRAVAKESRRLEKDLEARIRARIDQARFEEYVELHRRSRIIADKRYALYARAKRGLDDIGSLLVAIGKGEVKVTKAQKKELYACKDAIKATKNAHLANVRLLNSQTHSLKEKIRSECGVRGRKWAQGVDKRARMRGSLKRRA